MTETTATTTATGTGPAAVGRYVDFWNAATDDERRRLAAAFTEGIAYHTPIGILRGSDALIGFRAQFAEHAPDAVLKPRAEPESHHDRARLQWELVVEGRTFATGTDVLELDADGRIASVTVFLDQAPDGFDPHAHG